MRSQKLRLRSVIAATLACEVIRCCMAECFGMLLSGLILSWTPSRPHRSPQAEQQQFESSQEEAQDALTALLREDPAE